MIEEAMRTTEVASIASLLFNKTTFYAGKTS